MKFLKRVSGCIRFEQSDHGLQQKNKSFLKDGPSEEATYFQRKHDGKNIKEGYAKHPWMNTKSLGRSSIKTESLIEDHIMAQEEMVWARCRNV